MTKITKKSVVKDNIYRRIGKRIFDLAVVFTFFIMFWWVFLAVAILVRKNLGAPVFFKQQRPGLNGRIFKMYKFRSMNNAKDENGNLLSDEKRLTKFGKLLRASSLDELPELINVCRGEMSIVGPRPLLVEYLQKYSAEQAKRHDVKPGITGWAQVNGRNAISWEKKFEYDVEYVERYSFVFDLKIILMTIKKVFFKEGISHAGTATMEKFEGTKNE